MAVTADDIVNSAANLLGSPYREWYAGASIPMWLDDGYGATPDSLPPVSYFQQNGVWCSDLINYALIYNGLPHIESTDNNWKYLLHQTEFDPNTPGQTGAVAYQPYISDAIGYQGHIALYWNEYYLIQSIPGYFVTKEYTDRQTYWMGSNTAFTVYGFLPGVEYDAPIPRTDNVLREMQDSALLQSEVGNVRSTEEAPKIRVDFSEGAYAVLEDLARRKNLTISQVVHDAVALEKWYEDTLEQGGRILVERDGKQREVQVRRGE